MLTSSKVDFIHFQETSPKIHVMKTGSLLFVTYIVVPLSSVSILLLIYSYGVVNLYQSNLSNLKTTLSPKIGLFNQLDVLHTKKDKICAYTYNFCYIFFSASPSFSLGLGPLLLSFYFHKNMMIIMA